MTCCCLSSLSFITSVTSRIKRQTVFIMIDPLNLACVYVYVLVYMYVHVCVCVCMCICMCMCLYSQLKTPFMVYDVMPHYHFLFHSFSYLSSFSSSLLFSPPPIFSLCPYRFLLFHLFSSRLNYLFSFIHYRL